MQACAFALSTLLGMQAACPSTNGTPVIPLLPPAQVLGACARTLEGQAGGRPLSPALRDVLLDVVKLYALYRLEQASFFGRRGMICPQPGECSADSVAHPPKYTPRKDLSWCLH